MADEQDNMTPEQMAQYQKDNCIFCKIISGEIPSKKVYEDADFIGILDINPATEGHVLLMPKQHFQILPQIPQDIVGNLGIACSKVSNKIIKSFKCEGTTVFVANGGVAGQRAPHFIVHIIPRKDGDGISLNPKLADIDDRLFNTVKDRLLASMRVPRQASSSSSSAPNHNKEFKESQKAEVEEEQNEGDSLEESEPEYDYSNAKNAEETQTFDEEDTEETELEQEHRLKKERDSKRKKAPSVSEKKEKSKQNTASLSNKAEKSEPKKSSGVDFDKLSRLFGK